MMAASGDTPFREKVYEVILPTYIAFLWPGGVFLIVIRILRVLRIFRILRLLRYMGEATLLANALLQARRKIMVFLYVLLTLMTIVGLVEGPENGFTSIPRSIYWAIVTITTVGFGDIVAAWNLSLKPESVYVRQANRRA